MGITKRDRNVYEFLLNSGLTMTIEQLSNMFYSYNQNGTKNNKRSAYVIAHRRMNKLEELGYINCLKKSKWQPNDVYYAHNRKIQSKQLRHELSLSEFVCHLTMNGFKILDIKREYLLPEKYSIRCDAFVLVQYGNKKYYIIVEVGTTHFIDVEKYNQLINDINKHIMNFKYETFIINISDKYLFHPTILTIKTDISDINKFIWKLTLK